MFDYLRSSYDLGENFKDVVEFQTKDLEYGIGGTMTLYWLDPLGRLWKPSYIGTNDLEFIEEGDPDYNEKLKFLNYRWVSTGKHGKYSPYPITDYVEIYPSTWKGEWNDWPRLRLHFVNGVLQDFKDITLEQKL